MKNFLRRSTILISASVLATACATAPSVKEDKVAAERSKQYIEGVVYAPTSKSSAVCALPPGADKIITAMAGASKDWKDWLSRANACTEQKNWKTLEQVAQAMARVDLDSPWGAYFMSVAAEGRGEWARALWMVELAQKKAGGVNALFAYQKGRVLLGAKETVKAMAELEKATALSPSFSHAHLFLAQVYHRDLEWDKAQKHYEAAVASDDHNVESLMGLAEMRLHAGQGDAAAELYGRAIAVDATRGEAWIRLGYIYESVVKNPAAALTTYKGLKASLEKGAIHERPAFDLNAKIKTLEETVKPAARAQASVAPEQE